MRQAIRPQPVLGPQRDKSPRLRLVIGAQRRSANWNAEATGDSLADLGGRLLHCGAMPEGQNHFSSEQDVSSLHARGTS